MTRSPLRSGLFTHPSIFVILLLIGIPYVDAATTPPTTVKPTQPPTTMKPTQPPTTMKPTQIPTFKPTQVPTTMKPTQPPTTMKPSQPPSTMKPSRTPTFKPTQAPTTMKPSQPPSTIQPTQTPTFKPTQAPTTMKPTLPPTTIKPTQPPTSMKPTQTPTFRPTQAPTTMAPTQPPTTIEPTHSPTTIQPTTEPTKTTTNSPTSSDISFGTLSNWDTYCVVPNANGAGSYEVCHGFEIELEDLPCSSVYYTFSYNRYGAPNKTDTLTGGCIISYKSEYDHVNNAWFITTPVPSSLLQGEKVVPTGGHSCFSSGQSDYITSGCEHFGVSLASGSSPSATKYRWLIENPTAPGTLMPSMTRVGIPAVSWSVQAGPAGGGNAVAAVIKAEPQEAEGCACSKWGEPKFVKVFVTEIEYECDLDHLLTDSIEVPQSSSETEIEWVLLQGRPTCDENCLPIAFNESENELELSKEVGSEKKSIIRRYEFYEYTGNVTENNEAQPGNGCEAQPDACNIIGNYLGAQMAAAVIRHGNLLDIATQSPVMTGTKDVGYSLLLTAVGGTPPYSWSLTHAGALFGGLNLSSDGFISGTPIESGTVTFEVNLVDSDAGSVSKSLSLSISDSSSPSKLPSTSPSKLRSYFPTYTDFDYPTYSPIYDFDYPTHSPTYEIKTD